MEGPVYSTRTRPTQVKLLVDTIRSHAKLRPENKAMAMHYLNPPPVCNGCGGDFDKTMYDMKTKQGPWGNLCENCAMHGIGIAKLGQGFGQKYKKQTSGKWLKIAG